MPALNLPPELTHLQARACLERLLQTITAPGTAQQVQLDASALQRFDSSALAVLLACRRCALEQGKQLQVHHLPEGLAQLARLYGVEALW